MLTRLTIAGMHAVHAVRAVQTALGGLPGVAHAEVRLGEALVEHDASVYAELLREAVATAGFEVVAIREEPRRLKLL